MAQLPADLQSDPQWAALCEMMQKFQTWSKKKKELQAKASKALDELWKALDELDQHKEAEPKLNLPEHDGDESGEDDGAESGEDDGAEPGAEPQPVPKWEHDAETEEMPQKRGGWPRLKVQSVDPKPQRLQKVKALIELTNMMIAGWEGADPDELLAMTDMLKACSSKGVKRTGAHQDHPNQTSRGHPAVIKLSRWRDGEV